LNKLTAIWFFIAMFIYAIGMYISKLYSIKPCSLYYYLPVIIFMLVSLCWMNALKTAQQMAIFGSIWNITCLLITVLISITVFKESISFIKYIGILFGAVAIILLSL
jgi:multidrug transporter EmrE-like cation transporter